MNWNRDRQATSAVYVAFDKPKSLFWYLLEHGPTKLHKHLQSTSPKANAGHGGTECDVKCVFVRVVLFQFDKV